ncbi:Translationally-controlled tumor protein [Aspergillus pseudotamarii]|uniref:Translationally-controlled tumor protein homolog n=1 Tax=Aspergillus pseudotamarii TaxID=132259 RepID=A0A5N6TBC3_ASPPS|nr:Translationally-controlled tumor protein [Aspergillus pseudotamarii]KAE8143421.1 Translationally-controlled tumor protein [Aspergillus pseudotamarii]
MSLFIDVISNDEMFSDSFPIKVVDDIVYEVNCVLIQVTGDTEIGTEQEEALEDNIRIVNNLVHTFRLQPTTFDKKSYLMHLKRSTRLNKASPSMRKKIVANFRTFEFYTGMNMNGEAMVALLNYRSDGVTPFFTFWKDGLNVVDH